jgi:acyl-CoA reductase-like NAD-dependent aldehyde dehydrogenase
VQAGADGRTFIVNQEQNMNTQKFIESGSADPYVAGLYQRAVKVLNDSGLNRQQREEQIRRLQNNLREHQEAVASKTWLHPGKTNSRATGAANNQQGLTNRRLELAGRNQAISVAGPETSATPAPTTRPGPPVEPSRRQRNRPILCLPGR